MAVSRLLAMGMSGVLLAISAAAGAAPANQTASDRYANRNPQRDAPRGAIPLRRNCGTHWTQWVGSALGQNPCPAGCESEGEPIVRSHQAGKDEPIRYSLNYQCYHADPASRTLKAGGQLAATSEPGMATIAPAQGAWGATLRVTGKGVGEVNGAHVTRFPDDDAQQQPQLRLSAKIARVVGPDEIEIELPAAPAQGGGEGVLRLYLEMRYPARAALAGRYTIGTGQPRLATRALPAQQRAGEKAATLTRRVIRTDQLSQTGRWPATMATRTLRTETLSMIGRWPALTTRILTIEGLRMTGRWPTDRPYSRIITETLKMTGRGLIKQYTNPAADRSPRGAIR